MPEHLKLVSTAKSHGGAQHVYSHLSTNCSCEMTFAIFVPPQARERRCPVVWYLSGLTCTHANVMEKGEYRRIAAELGFIVVCPDTSPRGAGIPDEKDNWQFGTGAGFYLDATQEPYAKNYRMYSYIVEELPAVIGREFPADMARQSIFGHSMGGHGALTIALKNPARFRSCSAFAPIVQPSTAGWSKPASKNISAWMRPRGGATMPLRSSRTDTVSRNSWSIRERQTVSSRRASGLGCSKTRAPRQAFR